MDADAFLALALGLPETELCSHMRQPDIRVRGKIFAGPVGARGYAVIKLTPEQQEMMCGSSSRRSRRRTAGAGLLDAADRRCGGRCRAGRAVDGLAQCGALGCPGESA